MKKLEGKNAIITGANRGIGYEIVKKFASEGCNIWACARCDSEDFRNKISYISEQYDVNVEPIFFELANPNEIKEGFQQIYKKKRNIDILVNAAGVVNVDLFQRTSMKKFREVFEVNYFGAVCLTQYVIKVMQRVNNGSIINIASISGIDANPTNCAYGSSKAAIIHFSRILASEMGSYNIRVNAVAPGPTNTDMIKAVEEAVGHDNMLSRCALARMAEPEEIANVVAFLGSDESSFINGQVIRVDGGSK